MTSKIENSPQHGSLPHHINITFKFLYHSLTLNAVLLAQTHNVLSQKFWSGENFAWWIKLLEIGPRQCDLQGYWSACEVMIQAQIDIFV